MLKSMDLTIYNDVMLKDI